MRVVLDTNVIVKAFRSPAGASAALLRLVRDGKAIMLASPPLFFEYEQVLAREEHLRAADATLADLGRFLDAMAHFLKPVEVHFLWRPQLTDAEDEMVLEAAEALKSSSASGGTHSRQQHVLSELG